jgi:hypothetical protein
MLCGKHRSSITVNAGAGALQQEQEVAVYQKSRLRECQQRSLLDAPQLAQPLGYRRQVALWLCCTRLVCLAQSSSTRCMRGQLAQHFALRADAPPQHHTPDESW